MIKFIDDISKSSEKILIGISKDKFYINRSNYDKSAMLDYDEEKISSILNTVK